MKPNDLRGILHYIPRFRGKTFVISVDGAIVSEENFANVLLDLAVLRSLNIRVVLTHGAAFQLQQLAGDESFSVSDLDGEGQTSDETLELAMTAGNRVAHEILEGLARYDLRAAVTNAIKALPLGIIGGVNQLNTGKVERIDVELLSALLDRDVIPVVPPLGFDGNGDTFRVSSDSIAVAVAEALGAVKLVFVTTHDGILDEGQLIREMPASVLAGELEKERASERFSNVSKAKYAVKACDSGVPRVHVINGRTNEGLLTEVFSNEGIGTLVYGNDYQQIRSARKKDLRVLLQLTRDSMASEELTSRTREEIARHLEDYYIFEIDRHPIGCVALHLYPEDQRAELAFLCVSRSHENQGIGQRLIKYVEDKARQAGVGQVFLLSTQSYTYFESKAGYVEGTDAELPVRRREAHLQSGRNSKILIKNLKQTTGAEVRSG